MLSTEVCFIKVFISPSYTPLYGLFPLINSRLILTPPCPTLSLASNIYTLLTSIPSFHVPLFFFSITHYYCICHNSQHEHDIFFPLWYSNAVTTFETNPYLRQYHFFFLFFFSFFFFSRQYGTPTNKVHRQILLTLLCIFTHINKFFLFIINPRILSFS